MAFAFILATAAGSCAVEVWCCIMLSEKYSATERPSGPRGSQAECVRRVGSGPLAVAAQVSERTRGGVADRLSPVQLVCVSAASKMVASTATYPHEVIRSYMHIQVCPPAPLPSAVSVCSLSLARTCPCNCSVTRILWISLQIRSYCCQPTESALSGSPLWQH